MQKMSHPHLQMESGQMESGQVEDLQILLVRSQVDGVGHQGEASASLSL